jgi:hypothetical protein
MESRHSRSDVEFVSFLVRVFCAECKTRPLMSVSDLSRYMRDHLQPLDPSNLYRKQYGNMDQCLKNGKVDRVFWLDGSIIRPLESARLTAAVSSGVLTRESHDHLVAKIHELDEFQRDAQARLDRSLGR